MVTLDWECERTDGVTLVQVYVAARRTRRVRVANRLDGPVWPPRRRGQPAAGWDDGAIEGVVGPDDRLVAGYATPAPPADPPVELVADEPADTGTEGFDAPAVGTVESTPAGVVRSLGDPIVPRDAVAVPGGDGTERSPGAEPTATESTPAGDRRRSATRQSLSAPGETGPAPCDGFVVPDSVRAWLAAVERRLATAERTTVAPGSPLGTALAGDRRALVRVARRVSELTGRVDDIDRRDARRSAER